MDQYELFEDENEEVEENQNPPSGVKGFLSRNSRYFKFLASLSLKGAQYLAFDYYYNRLKERGVYRENEENKGQFTAWIVAGGLVCSLGLTGLAIWTSMQLKQKRIKKQYEEVYDIAKEMVRIMIRRACMLSTLKDYYDGKISKDEIIQVYLNKAEENAYPDDEDMNVDNIIVNHPENKLIEFGEKLSWEFLKIYKKYNDIGIMKKHPQILQPYSCYGWALPRLAATLCGCISSRFINVTTNFVDQEGERVAVAKDSEIKNEISKTTDILREQYEKYFGFLNISFGIATVDEIHRHVSLTEVEDINGDTHHCMEYLDRGK
jgi:hypothetical protein